MCARYRGKDTLIIMSHDLVLHEHHNTLVGVHLLTVEPIPTVVGERDYTWSVTCFDAPEMTERNFEHIPCCVMHVAEDMIYRTADVPAGVAYRDEGRIIVNVEGDGTTDYGHHMLPMTPHIGVCGLAACMEAGDLSWCDTLRSEHGFGRFLVWVRPDSETGLIRPYMVLPYDDVANRSDAVVES